MIPVLKIPANGPWCSETEFNASETSTGHMIEAKRPMAGNAISDTRAGPNNAAVRQSTAPMENAINTLPAVKQLEQSHAHETSGGEHSPEPGNGGRTGRMRIVAVILGEKL